MWLNPNIIKRIKQIVFLANEPHSINVIWAKPGGNDLWEFYLFDNGKWQNMAMYENVVIPDISVNLSAFNNDAGFLTEHQSLDSYVNGGSYDSQTKRINLKHDNAVLISIDATDFIKDGMISDVTVENGNIVIIFNTDAGKEPIELPLTSIFNPDNYYTKEEINQALAGKADANTLSAVATSGDYNDLNNLPSIPEVPDNISAFYNDLNYTTPDTFKTVNGESVVGNGNIEITSATPFKDSWRTGTSIEDFCSDVMSSDIKVGEIYLGELTCSGLPTGMANGEVKVEVLGRNYSKILLLTVTSTNLSPYHWEMSCIGEHLYGWRSWMENRTLAAVATTGNYNDLSNKPTIPTVPSNVSAFTNDAGYLTSHQDISGKADKQDIQYEDVFLGVAATSEEAIIVANHHDILLKGRSVLFSNASGYIWAILPEEYIPIVKMNGFEIPIDLDATVTVNETTYKVWKSNSSFSGTLSIYLL